MPKVQKLQDKQAEIFRPALAPRPRLFKILCLVYAVWMVALLVMYFWTVYPVRHPHGPSGGVHNSSRPE